MTPNRRRMKRRIKPPKRYEGSVYAISKRNDSDQDTSNDEILKDDMGNKGIKDVEVCLNQNRLETGEIDETDSITDKNDNHKVDGDDRNKANSTDVNGGKTRSYANMVKKDEALVNKELMFIAPKITEDGVIKVLFDEEIVNKGCAKWKFTICGQFIGQNMGFY
ncbi:hypothetical protein Tco_0419180 [Tanacetum coccineum]